EYQIQFWENFSTRTADEKRKRNAEMWLFSDNVWIGDGIERKNGWMRSLDSLIVRDLDDYIGSQKGVDDPFVLELLSIPMNSSPSITIVIPKTSGSRFCNLLSQLKKFSNEFVNPNKNDISLPTTAICMDDSKPCALTVSKTYTVVKQFESRCYSELLLIPGIGCEILKLYKDSIWALAHSPSTNRTGLFPLWALHPTPQHTPGPYTVHTAYPKRNNSIHPLHIPLKPRQSLTVVWHSLKNHLLVYVRNFDTFAEGWVPVFSTFRGPFICVEIWEGVVAGKLAKVEKGTRVDVELVLGFETVVANVRGERVKMPLWHLEPMK
ncbi:hypothetical protein HK096_008850, partial [Nowakowskiella sp. JEL0078]